MKDKLTNYVELLFAGAGDSEDVKQEILQNTLDRYDDLISQGKSPESAYTLAIAGIGDIREILVDAPGEKPPVSPPPEKPAVLNRGSRLARAAAIMLFILCPIPLVLLGELPGLCWLLVMVALGVALLVFFPKPEGPEAKKDPRSPAHRILHGCIWGGLLALYFTLSFLTGAWYITWVLLPLAACLCGLVSACFELNKRFVSALVRILVFGLCSLLLITLLLGIPLGVRVVNLLSGETPVTGQYQESRGAVEASQVRDLEIQWVSGSVTLAPGDVQELTFRETGNFDLEDAMIWTLRDGKLTVKFSKPQVGIIGLSGTLSKDLQITYPRDWQCRSLELDSVSAALQITGLQGLDARVVTVSGECRLSDCVLDAFCSTSVSGNVEFTGSARELELNSVSGDYTLRLSGVPREVEMDAVSGDFILTLPEGCGFTLELDSVSGDFSSEFPTVNESRNRYTYGDGSCRIEADTTSGDVTVKKP